MTACVILDIKVTDPARFDQYRKLAPGPIAAYGGKYLARGGRPNHSTGLCDSAGQWQADQVRLRFSAIKPGFTA